MNVRRRRRCRTVPGRIRLVRAQGALGRLRGLLCRACPPGPRTGLLLSPCWAVHTIGMRYAIDVAFIDARGRVLRLARKVPPGRLLACRSATAVVELAPDDADTCLRRRRRVQAALCRLRAGRGRVG